MTGAIACLGAWLHALALRRGVVRAMLLGIWVHLWMLPDGSELGRIARVTEWGTMRCGAGLWRPDWVVLAKDSAGWWAASDGFEPGPGRLLVGFDLKWSSRAAFAPTCEIVTRYLVTQDEDGNAVPLPAPAAGVAREWYEQQRELGAEFDEALAGRMTTRIPIVSGYVHNAALGVQIGIVLLCPALRLRAQARDEINRLRRERGVCVRCEYPRPGWAAACPECGEPFAPGERGHIGGDACPTGE